MLLLELEQLLADKQEQLLLLQQETIDLDLRIEILKAENKEATDGRFRNPSG